VTPAPILGGVAQSSRPGGPPTLSASIFAAQQKAMREAVGAAVYERALAKLPPAESELARTASIGWIPFATVEAVMSAVADEAGRPVLAFQREMAKRLVDDRVRGVWKVLVRVTGLWSLFHRIDVFWNRSYGAGRIRVLEVEPGRALLLLDEIAEPSDFLLRGFAYNTEALFAHYGSPDAKVQWQRVPGGARFAITWRPPG
jgi:hypothetical protein